MRNLVILFMACLFTLGCGYRAEMLKGPTEVAGKVTKGCQPFGKDVLMLSLNHNLTCRRNKTLCLSASLVQV